MKISLSDRQEKILLHLLILRVTLSGVRGMMRERLAAWRAGNRHTIAKARQLSARWALFLPYSVIRKYHCR